MERLCSAHIQYCRGACGNMKTTDNDLRGVCGVWKTETG